jgi:plastocyanin
MRSRIGRSTLTLLAVALLVVSCSSSDDSDDTETTTTANPTTTTSVQASSTTTSTQAPTTTDGSGTTPPGDVLELAISAEDNEAFNLDRLRGKAGQPTTVTFKNKDTGSGEPHNWHVVVEAGTDEYATKITVGPDTQSVSFTIGKAGDYSFYCDTHAEAMKGILIVEP